MIPTLILVKTSILILTSCYQAIVTDTHPSMKFTVSRGNLASIFTAAYYMSIDRLNIHVSEASLSSPAFNMIYLRELDRLKENYTKDENLHQVIVAKSNDDDEIVGYIDIDRRNIFNKRFPTPYVSDLIVQPSWRNKGVATSLLEYCENVVCKLEWKEPHLHLLVETQNSKALDLYCRLNFIPLQAETGSMDDLSKIKITPLSRATHAIDDAPFISNINSEFTFLEGINLVANNRRGDGAVSGKRLSVSLRELLADDSFAEYDRILLQKIFAVN